MSVRSERAAAQQKKAERAAELASQADQIMASLDSTVTDLANLLKVMTT